MTNEKNTAKIEELQSELHSAYARLNSLHEALGEYHAAQADEEDFDPDFSDEEERQLYEDSMVEEIHKVYNRIESIEAQIKALNA